jgi:hypothetical protein
MKYYVNKGISYVLGSSAAENWKLIGLSERESTWVHLMDYASAHVVIEIDKVEKEELEYARELILNHTMKAPRTAGIVYSKIRDIKRGSNVGSVILKRGGSIMN